MRPLLSFLGRVFGRIVLPGLFVGMSVALLIAALGQVGAVPAERRPFWVHFAILMAVCVALAVTCAVLINLGWRRDRRALKLILEVEEAERGHDHG